METNKLPDADNVIGIRREGVMVAFQYLSAARTPSRQHEAVHELQMSVSQARRLCGFLVQILEEFETQKRKSPPPSR